MYFGKDFCLFLFTVYYYSSLKKFCIKTETISCRGGGGEGGMYFPPLHNRNPNEIDKAFEVPPSPGKGDQP